MRLIKIALIVVPFVLASHLAYTDAIAFHVSLDGDDANPGTQEEPFATLTRARDAIRALKASGTYPEEGVRVRIRGGRYYLRETFELEPHDSGTAKGPVTYMAMPGERVVISGGCKITGWEKQADGLWTVHLPEIEEGHWYFRQLFAEDKRLERACIPNEGYLTTTGPLSIYADMAANRYGGYGNVSKLKKEDPAVLCGFSFAPGDFADWHDMAQAEILTFHSWECSWQSIRKIDFEMHDVYFNTPCRYPIGFFSPHCRYRIENIEAAFDAPGEWYLANDSGLLSYRTLPGENPETMDIVAPRLERLVEITDDPASGAFVEHVRFIGLEFAHASYPMGIYDIARNWPEPVLKAHPDWPRNFWPGYTDSQAAPRCGEAIHVKGARNSVFDECTVCHVGAYALAIRERCRNIQVKDCQFYDLGGGGVLIGVPIREVIAANFARETAPSHNRITKCRIRNGGNVHPSAVGIWIAQSHHNTVSHNEIADFGYSGISLGWTWNRNPNYSDHNILEANHIHNVLQALDDGGGIYTLGMLEGCLFRENYIHDIQKAEGTVGAPVNGIFFDQGSQHVVLKRNVIRNTDAPVRFNQCKREDMVWQDNYFDTRLEGEVNEIVSAAGP